MRKLLSWQTSSRYMLLHLQLREVNVFIGCSSLHFVLVMFILMDSLQAGQTQIFHISWGVASSLWSCKGGHIDALQVVVGPLE